MCTMSDFIWLITRVGAAGDKQVETNDYQITDRFTPNTNDKTNHLHNPYVRQIVN